MDDRKLVNDFLQSRSEKAFRILYRSKTPHLYRMALRLTQNDTLSEELIQETWMVAIRKLAEFEWRSELIKCSVKAFDFGFCIIGLEI